MSATLRQRHALAHLTGAASYAAHAALPVERLPLVNPGWEQHRAAQHDLHLQAEALQQRRRAAGEVGCAPVERQPSRIERLTIVLRAEFGRGWWLALIGFALYAVTGTAAAAVVVAVCAGWWAP